MGDYEQLASKIEAIIERLARIEQNQQHLSAQLDRMATLSERVMRLEDRAGSQDRLYQLVDNRMRAFEQDLEEVRDEIQRWRTGRRLLAWLVATGVLTSAFIWAVKHL